MLISLGTPRQVVQILINRKNSALNVNLGVRNQFKVWIDHKIQSGRTCAADTPPPYCEANRHFLLELGALFYGRGKRGFAPLFSQQ